MSEELKPCPFCGGMRIDGYTSIDMSRIFREFLACEDCGASTTTYETKEEAVTAWNTRHERTCHKVPGKMHYGERRPKCSECGYGLGDDRWEFCPKCGAKVVG